MILKINQVAWNQLNPVNGAYINLQAVESRQMIYILTQIQALYTYACVSHVTTKKCKSWKHGEIVRRDIGVIPVTECLEEGHAEKKFLAESHYFILLNCPLKTSFSVTSLAEGLPSVNIFFIYSIVSLKVWRYFQFLVFQPCCQSVDVYKIFKHFVFVALECRTFVSTSQFSFGYLVLKIYHFSH